MKEEIKMIFDMLKEGKITAEEAEKLILAIEKTSNIKNLEDKLEKHIKNIAAWSKTLGNRFSDIGNTIAENSAEFINNLGEVVEKISKTYFWEPQNTLEKNYVLEPDGLPYSIHFELNSGNINIRKTDDKTLKIRLIIKSCKKETEDPITYNDKDHLIFIKTEKTTWPTKVNIEAFLPQKKFSEVFLKTDSGSISLQELQCDSLTLINSNGNLEAHNTKTQNIFINLTKGETILNNLDTSIIESAIANGRLSIIKSIFQKAVLIGSNSDIEIFEPSFTHSQCRMETIATDGSISVHLVKTDNVGYSITAKSFFGNVNISLPNIVSLSDLKNPTKKEIKVQSDKYETYKKTVTIYTTTTNGNITIDEK